MEDTIQKLIAPGKGLLAADESTHTIEKRFASISVVSTPQKHEEYRKLLFTTPGIERYLGGVILFDESVRQGLHKLLQEKGIIAGIKVDQGLEPFEGTEEKVTMGLETLNQRLKEYKNFGLKFTKWRAVVAISDLFPTDKFLEEDMIRLAKFAKISQENGFIPVVEPEILLDGNHTEAKCEEVETKTLKLLFDKLNSDGVNIENMLLKTSMVLPGKDSGVIAEPLEVSNATLRTLANSVPDKLPGIVFLSGGQSPDQATNNLNEINKLKNNFPWELSFSFSRALQNETLNIWMGKEENREAAQKVFIDRLERVSKARDGKL